MTKTFCDICGHEIKPAQKDGCFILTIEPFIRSAYSKMFTNADVCPECTRKIYKLIDDIKTKN